MKNQIQEILKIRNKAKAGNNVPFRLSAQINKIQASGIEGYMKTDQLKSTLLHAHNDNSEPKRWITLVQEDYFYESHFPHQSYLLYKLLKKKRSY